MGIYNLFTYNSGVLWGVDSTDDRLLWLFQVDWDNDGEFDAENEAPLITSVTIDRGRDYFLNTSSNGFEPVRPGKLTVKLENKDKRFDPYNTSSPLYPNVAPGKLCQITVKKASENVRKVRFTGYIQDIRPISGSDMVQITAVDKLQKYKETNVALELQSDISYSDAIEAILEDMGDTDYSIDSVLDAIPYYWVDKKRVMTAITELTDATVGTFFVAADGTAKYYSRYRNDVATVTIDQSVMLREIEVNQPWDTIRNNIEIAINPRELKSPAPIWTLGDKPIVSAGETLVLWGQFAYNDYQVPAINTVSPQPTTDYLMNSQEDGGGSNLTTDFSVSMDAFSQAAKLTIKNNGASAAYIIHMQVRGEAIAKTDQARLSEEDSSSIAIYGDRYFELDTPWMQNTNTAQDIMADLQGLMISPRRYPIFELEDQFYYQFNIDLFDRVDVSIAELGIDDAYRIGSLREEWLSENGQVVRSTISLEPIVNIITGDLWTFTTQIGETSRFG